MRSPVVWQQTPTPPARNSEREGWHVLDGLPLEVLGSVTGWTLVGACFLALMTGRLVPIRTVRREQDLIQREAAAWKLAHDTESAQLDRIVEQLQRIVPPQPAVGPPPGPVGQAVR